MLKVCDVFKEKELKMALRLLGITQFHVDEAEDRTRSASPQVRLNLAGPGASNGGHRASHSLQKRKT